ncbi:MAG: FAD-binding oxidoreductase [bacterium]|nr:FAD-binding oxidoreductase [bacterium]
MKEEIKKFFKGEVENSEQALMKYSRDASIFEVRPKLVLFPKDTEDVKNLVKWVAENKELYDHPGNPGASISITARCAGTDMSGGAIGESLIVDFTKYMNKLVGGPLPIEDGKNKKINLKLGSYPALPSYISVEPGMFYRDFEKITLEKNLILPCYTASKNINAIGGMFGNNSAGERTLKYGQTERYVLRSKVVFGDGNEYEVKPLNPGELDKKMAQGDFEGNLYKNIFNLINENQEEIRDAKPAVQKNSAGYFIWNVWKDNIFDLNKLLVGSQGTLGILTEVTLKIIPENKYSKLATISMYDLAALGRVVGDILTFSPDTLETYDDKSLRLAVKYFPDFLKNKGFWAGLKFLKNFLPEFRMLLTGRFPKLVILVEFRGDDEKILEDKCLALKTSLKDFTALEVNITKGLAEANKYWAIRHENFSLLRNHVKKMHSAPFIDDVIVRPDFLPKFLPELKKILDDHTLIYAIAGHAGDGNFHIFPMLDFNSPKTAKTILEVNDKVFDLVHKYHGSMAAEHNDGLIRTPYLENMYGKPITAIFKTIKEIFDPKNIFNPGKKVPAPSAGNSSLQAGTKEYIAAHIALEHHSEQKI